jgi:succinate-semialdehyde dehydrogenase/glutarate-semialdehyde dehydrogenase
MNRKKNIIREHSIKDLKRAVDAARAAQKSWREKSFRFRKKIILRLRGILIARADEIAQTIAGCTGKTRIDALAGEVIPSAMAADFYAKRAQRFLKKRRVRPGNLLMGYKRSFLLHEPWGVVGIISPWNYPFGIPFHEVTAGLMAGNAVILKTATLARIVGEAISGILSEADVPSGLFHIIHLPGSRIGRAFIDAGIDKLFFTGSIAVGKELMKLAATRLLPVCLELGGNDAMIVCEDASLERAAGGALWAGLSNCGQSCGGVERIYVHERVAQRFGALLKEKLLRLRVGRENEFDVDIGTLTTREQYETVTMQVEEALAMGARIAAATGSRDPKKLIHPAMIIDRVKSEMKLMRDETFGPILALDTFATEDEAIQKANGTIYGLSASIWSKNIRRAKKLAARLAAGAVLINDHLMSHGLAETPWGGYKQSGIGRAHGEWGFYEMTQVKVVVGDILHRLPRSMWWYPHSRAVYQRLKGIMDFLFAISPFKKLSGLMKIIKLLAACFRKW